MKQTLAAANRPFRTRSPFAQIFPAIGFWLLCSMGLAVRIEAATGSFSMGCDVFSKNKSPVFIEIGISQRLNSCQPADPCTKIGPAKLQICRPTDPGISVFVNFDHLILAGDTTGIWADGSNSGAVGSFPFLEFTHVAAGIHPFFYKIRSATADCPDSLFLVEIAVGETPVADAGADFQLDCFHEIAQIGAAGQPDSLLFEWSERDFGDHPQVGTGRAGTYSLKTIDPVSGCFSMDSVVVKKSFGKPFFKETTAVAPRCYGEKTGFIEVKSVAGGMPPMVYSIDNQPFSDVFLFEKLGAGSFLLKMEDAAGCESDTFLTLAEPPLLTLFAGSDSTVFLGDSIQLLPSANFFVARFFWAGPGISPKNWQPKIELLADARFKLTAFNALGCRAESGFSIKVERDLSVFFPNVFSPGGGGEDAFFCPKMDERRAIRIRHFFIKDRWGELVFSSENMPDARGTVCWDGRFRGKICPNGAYLWSAEVVLADGSVELRAGDVTLVR